MSRSQIDNAVGAMLGARKVLLTCHGKPDGDTLGSALALGRALRSMGKVAIVLSQDSVPETFAGIPESETVVSDVEHRDFDLAIVCDVQQPLRADRAEAMVNAVNVRVFIDHHLSEECNSSGSGNAGKIVVCDPTAAATGELIFDIIAALGVELDEVMANQLMWAVVSDTGAFRFTNVTPRTFEIASHLAELGASASAIAKSIYETRSFVSMKLLGNALASLESACDGRVVWAKITQDDFQNVGATDEDTDSVVNMVRSIKDADVGMLFRDLGDSIRVSLRSHGTVDVARIAGAFDGGGHKGAAGCTLNIDLENAIKQVVAEAVKCAES